VLSSQIQTQAEVEAREGEKKAAGGGGGGGAAVLQIQAIAFTELDGVLYVIGGTYHEKGPGPPKYLNTVYCLDTKSERGSNGCPSQLMGGVWIEQEEPIITARYDAAATAFEGKVWLAGGRDAHDRCLSSIEVLDPLVHSWQAAGNLASPRHSLALLVVNNELYAAGFDNTPESTSVYKSRGYMFVEKRDRHSGVWRIVSEHNDSTRSGQVRDECSVVACGSSIYFLGGYGASSWNRFDTASCTWLSQEMSEKDRQLPRFCYSGQAVCITPNEISSWTSYPDFARK